MLAAQVQTKDIDGVAYSVLPLGALASARVAAKALRMAAPAFGDVASLVAASKAVTSVLDGLASGILSDLDDDVIVYCIEAFAKVTSFEVDGRKLPLVSDNANLTDEHFRVRYWNAAAERMYGHAEAEAVGHAHDHRRVGTVEGAREVPGVGQRPARHFQRQQLVRADLRHHRRRHLLGAGAHAAQGGDGIFAGWRRAAGRARHEV